MFVVNKNERLSMISRLLLLSALILPSVVAVAQESPIRSPLDMDGESNYSYVRPSGWQSPVVPEMMETHIFPHGTEGIFLIGDCLHTKNSLDAEARKIDDWMSNRNRDKTSFSPMKRLSRTPFTTKSGVKGLKIVYSYRSDPPFRQTVYLFPATKQRIIKFSFEQKPLNVQYDPTIDASTVDAAMRSLIVY